ncbi:MAG: SLC13 family permease, partial [Acidobacteriota bacterium]
MGWEVIFIMLLLVAALVSFVLERVSPDQTAFVVFAALVLAGYLPIEGNSLPKVEELLVVFANPAPITIAAMFVLSAALSRCGVVDRLASGLDGLAKRGYIVLMLGLTLLVAITSAFINNTPVVMIFLPVVLSLARTAGVPASKLLIPLSYASIFGGVCTLVGTSTNILASGILESSGEEPLSMFELSVAGLPLLVLGTAYLLIFGKKALPDRETLTSLLTPEDRREFILEAYVRDGSALVGKTVVEAGLRSRVVRVAELIREGVAERDLTALRLAAGDRLVLAAKPSGFVAARAIDGLAITDMKGSGLETVAAAEGSIVEGIIGPTSPLVGERLGDVNFRQRYRLVLLAIHRRGHNLRQQIDEVVIEPGDLLLMMGTDSAISQLRQLKDILLLDAPAVPTKSLRTRAPFVLATVVAVVVVAALNILPIVAAALCGVAVLLLSRVIEPREGYASVEWSILILIYSMLAFGVAMHSTGADGVIGRAIASLVEVSWLAPEWRPYAALAVVYLTTSIMTETLSNNATVAVMTPIALSLGEALGVDARPFVIATCIASSASFATPIGYQTNTYVYGVGGYRFTDFLRFGLPLNLLYFAASVVL